jgi:septal ring factor EnvC (AmiA/AmiB activator)
VTGAVVASVVLGGGVAVASSLNAAEASPTSSNQTVGDLQTQLAQLQGETADLNDEITAAGAALTRAQKAQAARDAAAARAATQARIARSHTTVHVAATSVTKKSTVKAHTAPKSHTSTGASGSGEGGDDHEAEGGSDD